MNAGEILSNMSTFVMLSMHGIATLIAWTLVALAIFKKARPQLRRPKWDKKTPKRQDKFLVWVGIAIVILASWSYLTLTDVIGIAIGGPTTYLIVQVASFAFAMVGFVTITIGALLSFTIPKLTLAEKHELEEEAAKHAAPSARRRASVPRTPPVQDQFPKFGGLEALELPGDH